MTQQTFRSPLDQVMEGLYCSRNRSKPFICVEMLVLLLCQWFSTKGNVAPQEHLVISGDILVVTTEGHILEFVVEATESAKQPAVHRAASTTKHYLGPNADSVELEKSSFADERLLLSYPFCR